MKYQVAEYIIDTARYRISAGDAAIPAEPKVFDLLVYLIRHRDRVLSREELFQEVWDGREVSDATLSNHVKSARKILGDSGELQKTILTIRGRGYQFIAPVEVIPEGGRDAAEDKAPPLPPATDRVAKAVAPAWRLPLAIVGVLLFAALLGWRSSLHCQARPGPAVALCGRRALRCVRRCARCLAAFRGPDDAGSDPQPAEDIRPAGRAGAVGVYLQGQQGARSHPAPIARRAVRARWRGQHVRWQQAAHHRGAGGSRTRAWWSGTRTTRVAPTTPNFFAMQSGIAAAVSDSLKVAILADEQRALDEFPTTNLKAYEAYVAGRYQLDLLSMNLCHGRSSCSTRPSRSIRSSSTPTSPGAMPTASCLRYFEPPINMLQKVVDSLSEAQELRPDSAEAWSSLGLTYVMAWRWKDAWIALNKAKRRDPTLAQTELGFALYYSGLGEAEKVKRALADADRLDPLNMEMADWGNWALFMVGESKAARDWVDKKMQQHPDVGIMFSGAGVGAYIAGDFERAVRLAERGAELDGSPVALIMLAQAYGYAGQKEKVLPLLEKAASAGTYICPYESAAAYLSIDDKERAISLLDEAVEKRSNCLIFLRNDPRLEPIRQHPHFAVLLNRVGLDDDAVAIVQEVKGEARGIATPRTPVLAEKQDAPHSDPRMQTTRARRRPS